MRVCVFFQGVQQQELLPTDGEDGEHVLMHSWQPGVTESDPHPQSGTPCGAHRVHKVHGDHLAHHIWGCGEAEEATYKM